jgi:hypothetical protein
MVGGEHMIALDESFVVLILSILCGVLGVFLLAHRGVRMMRGGLLYRLSIGLAAVGIALGLSAAARVLNLDSIVSDSFQVVALIVLFFVGYSAWLTAHAMQTEA